MTYVRIDKDASLWERDQHKCITLKYKAKRYIREEHDEMQSREDKNTEDNR